MQFRFHRCSVSLRWNYRPLKSVGVGSLRIGYGVLLIGFRLPGHASGAGLACGKKELAASEFVFWGRFFWCGRYPRNLECQVGPRDSACFDDMCWGEFVSGEDSHGFLSNRAIADWRHFFID